MFLFMLTPVQMRSGILGMRLAPLFPRQRPVPLDWSLAMSPLSMRKNCLAFLGRYPRQNRFFGKARTSAVLAVCIVRQRPAVPVAVFVIQPRKVLTGHPVLVAVFVSPVPRIPAQRSVNDSFVHQNVPWTLAVPVDNSVPVPVPLPVRAVFQAQQFEFCSLSNWLSIPPMTSVWYGFMYC